MGSKKKEKKDHSSPKIIGTNNSGNNGGDATCRYKMFLFKRKFKIQEPEPPLDVKRAFLKYSYDSLHMDPDGLHRFFVQHQQEVDLPISRVQDIIKAVILSRDNVTRETLNGLTIDDFFYFLLFDDEFNGPIKLQVTSLSLSFTYLLCYFMKQIQMFSFSLWKSTNFIKFSHWFLFGYLIWVLFIGFNGVDCKTFLTKAFG